MKRHEASSIVSQWELLVTLTLGWCPGRVLREHLREYTVCGMRELFLPALGVTPFNHTIGVYLLENFILALEIWNVINTTLSRCKATVRARQTLAPWRRQRGSAVQGDSQNPDKS